MILAEKKKVDLDPKVLGIDMKYRGGYSWGGVNMGEPADETVSVADSPATWKTERSSGSKRVF